jgi:hypothetical protein
MQEYVLPMIIFIQSDKQVDDTGVSKQVDDTGNF